MGNAASIFNTLAQQDSQRIAHDQAGQQGGNAESIFNTLARQETQRNAHDSDDQDPMLAAFTARAQQRQSAAPAAEPSDDDRMLAAFTARKAAQSSSAADTGRAEKPETGILAGVKRNSMGAITGLFHAFTDPATDQERAELKQKVEEERAAQAKHGYDPREVSDDVWQNPSGATLALHRILDAPARELSEKAHHEEEVAADLLKNHKYWKGGNLYLSGLTDKLLSSVPLVGPAINSIAERGEGALIPAINRKGENIQSSQVPAEHKDISGAATDLGAMLALEHAPAMARGAARTAGRIAETGANVVRQVTRGEKVAQPAAQAALRSGAEAASGVPGSAAKTSSLRTVLEKPIDTIGHQAKTAYRQIDEAAGTDFKALREKLENTEYQIRQLTETEEDMAKEAALEKSRVAITEKIEAAKQQAIEAGLDPKTLEQADAQFTQASALKDLHTKVFKNLGVISGNKAFGAEESVNVSQAVKELQKLQDSTKFGAPRLEQALGKEGAQAILQDMYAAQKSGVKAMTRQQWALRVGKVLGGSALAGAGAGAGYKIVRELLGL